MTPRCTLELNPNSTTHCPSVYDAHNGETLATLTSLEAACTFVRLVFEQWTRYLVLRQWGPKPVLIQFLKTLAARAESAGHAKTTQTHDKSRSSR